jgi:hypothetical protein
MIGPHLDATTARGMAWARRQAVEHLRNIAADLRRDDNERHGAALVVGWRGITCNAERLPNPTGLALARPVEQRRDGPHRVRPRNPCRRWREGVVHVLRQERPPAEAACPTVSDGTFKGETGDCVTRAIDCSRDGTRCVYGYYTKKEQA